MKEWFKKRRNTADEKEQIENNLTELEEQREVLLVEDEDEDKEFKLFFNDVLKKLPNKTSGVLVNAYDRSKDQAEKILAKSKDQFEGIFDEFLVGVNDETKRRTHSTIHAASLTAAIIGCSPIPFSDAFLLVPV